MSKMTQCAICEQSSLCEDDHFPVADRHSGTTTWPLCRACHDLTDRLPLYKWSPMLAWGSLTSLFEKANRDERLILVKLFKISADAAFSMRHQTAQAPVRRDKQPARQRARRGGPPIDYEKRVLATIREHGALTRKEVARETHGKTGKVWNAMVRLVEDGTIVVNEEGRLTERRPTLDVHDHAS